MTSSFDKLELLVPIIFMVLYFLGRTKKKQGEEGQQPPSEYEERTRRIREEMRKAIEERQSGRSPAPPPLPRESPVERSPEPSTTLQEPEPPPIIVETTVRQELLEVDEEALERQARLQELLLEARRKREEAEAQAEAVCQASARTAATPAQATSAAAAPATTPSLDWLRSPLSLRQAVIAREILGPPLALRKEGA